MKFDKQMKEDEDIYYHIAVSICYYLISIYYYQGEGCYDIQTQIILMY